MAAKRKLTENELIGFLIVKPARGALAEVLLDANSPPTESDLVAAAGATLKRFGAKGTKEEIRAQLGVLHALGLAEPVVVRQQVGYSLTRKGRAVVTKMFELPT